MLFKGVFFQIKDGTKYEHEKKEIVMESKYIKYIIPFEKGEIKYEVKVELFESPIYITKEEYEKIIGDKK